MELAQPIIILFNFITTEKRRRKRETLTVDLDEKFVYVPEGSVVGAYIPNDGIPVVGYKLGSSEYGLCVSAQGDGNETNLTCDINDWRRLHVVSNIGKYCFAGTMSKS